MRAPVRAAARALPPGTLPVGVGTVIAGIAAYGFLVLPAGTERLSPDQFAGVSALWFLLFTIAPGVFLPIEQETARAIAARRAAGEGARPVAVRSGLLALAIAAALVVATALAGPVLRDQLFGGDSVLLMAVFLAIAGFAPFYVMRGVLSGTDRFVGYSAMVGLDGVIRLVVVIGLVVAAVGDPGPYGLAIAVSPPVAAVIVYALSRPRLDPGPPREWREAGSAVGLLISAQIAAALLLNSVPLAAAALATEDQRSAAGRLSAAFVLARVPLFLFQAVQAALVPRLSALSAAGERLEFRSVVVRLSAALAGVSALGVLGAAAVGPPVVELLFGAEFAVDRIDIVLLAAGSGVLMMAVALSQALLADQRFRTIVAGYVAGVASFVVVAAAVSGLFLRVELGFLAAATVASSYFAYQVLGPGRR